MNYLNSRQKDRSGSSSPKRATMPKKLLREVLELAKTKDGRYTIKPVEDTLTFDKGFYVFVRALQLLKTQNEGVILVGLAGASGSGKTAFSEKIKNFIPGVVVISMDMYNDGSKVVDQNFDDPRLTDYECLLGNLADLKAGRTTQVPIYDFKNSRRSGYETVPVPTSRIIILEGIYALSDKLRPMLDLRVSITGGVHFDLVKRVLRDISRAGQGPEAIVQQVTETVYPMYKAFIEPNLQTAQLRIHNDFNPFSGFMNPTYILKSAKVPNLDLLRKELQALGEVREVSDRDLADIYLLPPGEDPETCQSWLRMRNREGRYSLMFEEWVIEEPFIISPRITFEVNVKILGGLMALGYEIGTIMRRTSHIFNVRLEPKSPSDTADITVKVDDVENLGHFVQLLGHSRQKVAQLGHALGLDGTYIPRSYIEQVQLEQLTAEFPAVTAELRDKLTTSDTSSQALYEILNASPPARMPRRNKDAGSGTDSLSCSAPPEAPVYNLGSAPSPTSNALLSNNGAAEFRQGRGSHGSSSNLQQHATPGPHSRPPSGLLHQQLQATTPMRTFPPAPVRTQTGFSPVSGPTLLSNGVHKERDVPVTPSHARPSSTLPPGQAPAGMNHEDAPGQQQDGHVDAGLLGLSVAMEQMESQLQSMTTCLSHYAGMQTQLEQVVAQQQTTQTALQQLNEATAALASNLQATLTAAQHLRIQPADAAVSSACQGSWWSCVGQTGVREQLVLPVGMAAGLGLLFGCVATGLLVVLSKQKQQA